MPGSDKLSFAPCEGRIVHQNTHSNRGRIDIDELQWCALLPVGKGFADVSSLESGETDNLTGARMFYLHLLKACVGEERCNRGALAPLIAMNANDGIAHAHAPTHDSSEGDSSEIIAVIQVRHEHLEKRVGRSLRR